MPGRGIARGAWPASRLSPPALTQRRPVESWDLQRRGRAGGKGTEELGSTLPRRAPCRVQPCSLSGILQQYQQLLILLSLSLQAKVLPHALLPLAKGPPPPCPERLARLSSGTTLQTWLKLLSHHTRVISQQRVTTRSWFEEGALVLILRSVVYMTAKSCFAFAVQECMYSYTSETRAGSPASTKSNNFFSTTDATRSGSPHPPDSSHSTCCGVFSGKPESRGKTAAYLPAIPQGKRRADVQGESQGTWAVHRGLIY